jgi:hypothetical protein
MVTRSICYLTIQLHVVHLNMLVILSDLILQHIGMAISSRIRMLIFKAGNNSNMLEIKLDDY